MYSNMKHTVVELEFYILQYLEGMTFPMLKNLGLQYENTYFLFEVRLYQQHGIDSLQPPNKHQHYSTEFREQVAQEHRIDKISIYELAIKYNVPSGKTIRSWIFRYTNGGESQSYNSKPEVYLMKGKNDLRRKSLKSNLAVPSIKSEPIDLLEIVKTSTITYKIALKKIMVFIQESHGTFNGIYGYRRRTIYLNHFQQAAVSHKCV